MAKDEVTFELQVFTGKRWETQGAYDARGEARALADAKALEKVSTIKQVKVVKEFYDTASGKTRVFTVYESVRKTDEPVPQKPRDIEQGVHIQRKPQPVSHAARKRSAAAKPARRGGSASPGEDGLAAPAAEQAAMAAGAPRRRVPIMTTLLQLVLSLVVAVLAAIVVTQLASMAMRGQPSIGFLDRDDFLIMVFIGAFAVTALALIARMLSRLKTIAVVPPVLRVPRGPAPAPRPSSAAPAAKMQKPAPKPHAPEVDMDAPMREAPDPGLEPETSEAGEPAAEAEARDEAPHEPDADEPPHEPEGEPEPEVLEDAEPPADGAQALIAMNAFTADVVDMVKGAVGAAPRADAKPDAHVMFGMVLFLVGAVQGLRGHERLDDDAYAKVMYQTLGTLGLSNERIEHFLEHADEYLIANPRYSEMFQHGRTAMGAYLDDATGPRGALADALAEWEKPKAKAGAADKPVTVLFTDIAGSTQLTQDRGDEAAQDIVRIHNAIVRDAIKSFGGKEIKHTGDGIMASFPAAAAGVEAARDMQRHVKAHNEGHPEQALGLKVGLNAGEPIAEDDDLFGTTVQLAARLVDKARAGQILVSGAVHGLSQGKNLKFERTGDMEMKGFDEPVGVYAALWDDAPAKADDAEARGAKDMSSSPETLHEPPHESPHDKGGGEA